MCKTQGMSCGVVENTMFQTIANMAFRRVFAATIFIFAAGNIHASKLTIEEAGQLALGSDFKLKAIEARTESLSELAVARESLPDPQLKLGFANLPTDSFNLGQEPMTQTVIGVR